MLPIRRVKADGKDPNAKGYHNITDLVADLESDDE